MTFASYDFSGTPGSTLQAANTSFVKVTGYSTDAVITGANRLRAESAANAVYRHTASPPSADYDVGCDLFIHDSSGDTNAGVVARCSSSAATFYFARWRTGVGHQLFRFVNGEATQLGATVGTSYSNGTTAKIRLRVEGSTISLFKDLDASPIISVTDTTITAAGFAGLYINNSGFTSGPHIDDWAASGLSTGPVLSSPTVVSTGSTIATVRVTTDTAPTGSSILAVRTRPASDPAWTAAQVLAAPTQTITSGSAGARDFNLTGLTNGVALRADFAQTGSNVVSTASFTPSTVPGAPTIGAAVAGNAQVTVNGTPPASNGGSAITLYRSTAAPGGSQVTGASLPITHTGLTNGVEYTFTLAAQNANGWGAESAASNAVTPQSGSGATLDFSTPQHRVGNIVGSLTGIGLSASLNVLMRAYNPATGALVLERSVVATNADGYLPNWTNAAFSAGTWYEVRIGTTQAAPQDRSLAIVTVQATS